MRGRRLVSFKSFSFMPSWINYFKSTVRESHRSDSHVRFDFETSLKEYWICISNFLFTNTNHAIITRFFFSFKFGRSIFGTLSEIVFRNVPTWSWEPERFISRIQAPIQSLKLTRLIARIETFERYVWGSSLRVVCGDKYYNWGVLQLRRNDIFRLLTIRWEGNKNL